MEFKKAYVQSKVWADLDTAITLLSPEQCFDLTASLTTVKEFTGLDMRQDFLLGLLRSKITSTERR